jgi:hypothetical protein
VELRAPKKRSSRAPWAVVSKYQLTTYEPFAACTDARADPNFCVCDNSSTVHQFPASAMAAGAPPGSGSALARKVATVAANAARRERQERQREQKAEVQAQRTRNRAASGLSKGNANRGPAFKPELVRRNREPEQTRWTPVDPSAPPAAGAGALDDLVDALVDTLIDRREDAGGAAPIPCRVAVERYRKDYQVRGRRGEGGEGEGGRGGTPGALPRRLPPCRPHCAAARTAG